MAKHEIMIVADYSQASSLSLSELCEICNISSDVVSELISYEIIHPKSSPPNQAAFEIIELQRAQTALRLQHDLEINFAGAALVLDLLDELERLRARANFLERQF